MLQLPLDPNLVDAQGRTALVHLGGPMSPKRVYGSDIYIYIYVYSHIYIYILMHIYIYIHIYICLSWNSPRRAYGSYTFYSEF